MASTRDTVVLEILAETKNAVGGLKKLVASIGLVSLASKAMQSAIEGAKLAAAFSAQEQAYQNLASSAGESGQAILQSMQDAAGGTISAMDTMRAASRASLLGIPVDKLDSLMEIARASAQATGESLSFMFESITTGLGRASPMILDNLGITVKVGEANKDYAAALGRTAESLTDTEKRQAFLNAVLVSGQTIIQNLSSDMDELTDVEKWEAFAAAVENSRAELGQAMQNIFGPAVEALSGYLNSVATGLGTNRIMRDLAAALAEDWRAIHKMTIAELDRYAGGVAAHIAKTETMLSIYRRAGATKNMESSERRLTASNILLARIRGRLAVLTNAQNRQNDADEAAAVITDNKNKLAAEQIRLYEAAKKIIAANRTEVEQLQDQIKELMSVEHGGIYGDAVLEAVEILKEKIRDLRDEVGLLSNLSLADVGHFADQNRVSQLTSQWASFVDVIGVMPELFTDAKDQVDLVAKYMAELNEIAEEFFTGIAMEGMYEFGKVIGDAATGVDALASAFSRMIDDFFGQIQRMLLRAGLEAIATGDKAMKWVGVGLVVASGLVALGRGYFAGKRAGDSPSGDKPSYDLGPSSSRTSREAGAGPTRGEGSIIINNTVIQGSLMANKDMAAQMMGFGR